MLHVRQTEGELQVRQPVIRLGQLLQIRPLTVKPDTQLVQVDVSVQVWQLLRVTLHN